MLKYSKYIRYFRNVATSSRGAEAQRARGGDPSFMQCKNWIASSHSLQSAHRDDVATLVMTKFLKCLQLTLIITLLPYFAVAEGQALRTITVRGQATQDFNPDIASFSVTVMKRSASREEAKASHDKMLKSLLDIAKKYKIDEKDLSTAFSSVNPNYEYPNGKRKFRDYSAQTSINITMRDLSQTGQFQDALVTAGFDNFQGPNYTLEKIYTYKDKVLTSALANAKQKAIMMAESLDEKIDKPVDIKEEDTSYDSPRPYMAKSVSMMATSESAVAPPQGVVTVKSSVTATFSLK